MILYCDIELCTSLLAIPSLNMENKLPPQTLQYGRLNTGSKRTAWGPSSVTNIAYNIAYNQWNLQDPKLEVLYHIRPM